LFPKVDAKFALVLQRIMKHELAGGDTALKNLLRGAVGDHGDFIFVLQQAEGQLQSGLTAADDHDFAHVFAPVALGCKWYCGTLKNRVPTITPMVGIRQKACARGRADVGVLVRGVSDMIGLPSQNRGKIVWTESKAK